MTAVELLLGMCKPPMASLNINLITVLKSDFRMFCLFYIMLATELPSPCFSSFNPYIDLRKIKTVLLKVLFPIPSSNVSQPHPEFRAITAINVFMILKVAGLCVEWDGVVILSC